MKNNFDNVVVFFWYQIDQGMYIYTINITNFFINGIFSANIA